MKSEKMEMVVDGGLPVQDDLLSRIVNAAAMKARFDDIGKLVEVFHEMKKAAQYDRYLAELLK